MLLIRRNVMMFFRDRSSVFFSLLVVIIIIGLYVLFLGDMMEGNLRFALGFDDPLIGVTMASLTFAGLVAVVSVSGSMSALEIQVNDKQHGAAKDFLTSPVSSGKLTRSYMLSSGIVGMIMSLAALVLSIAYIAARGGALPAPENWALLLLTLVLSVLCANSFMFFLVQFIKTANAFSAFASVVGTLLGFIMGVYIPVGILPSAVQWVIRVFPMSHAASMFRQILADDALAGLFAGAPPEALDNFRELYGVVLKFGDFEVSFWLSAAILAASTVLFYLLSLMAVKFKRG